MKRLLALALSLLLLVTLLVGCGSGGSGFATNGAAGDYAPQDSMQESTQEVPSAGGMHAAVNNDPSGMVPSDAKIIYTGELNLQTTDMEGANNVIYGLVSDFGGFFESQEAYLNRYSQDAYYVVRIPCENFYAFLNGVSESELCTVTYRNVTSENVGEAYADIENRLETLKIKLDRLQTLLQQAENMEDIITIEAAITEVEYQIEALSGEKNRYDSLINYSTVHISLCEVSVASEGVDPTLGQRLSSSFQRGIEDFLEGCEDFLVWLVGNWIGLIIFLAIVFGVVTVIRRKKLNIPRKKKKSRQEPPQEG